MEKCNMDCFNCPYPDCINDEMTAEDYQEALQRDRVTLNSKEKLKLNEKKRAYYADNRERRLAWQRDYYQANRDHIRAMRKAHYYANRAEELTKRKAYEEKNREKLQAWRREYYQENRERLVAYQRMWRREHRDRRNRGEANASDT